MRSFIVMFIVIGIALILINSCKKEDINPDIRQVLIVGDGGSLAMAPTSDPTKEEIDSCIKLGSETYLVNGDSITVVKIW